MDEYMDFWGGSYIVPPFEPSSPAPSRQPTYSPSYEIPWWGDTINRAIERASQVASLEVAGYPPYPSYPTPTPMPLPAPVPGGAPQQREGIQLSQTTLMLMVGGVLLFMLGKRGR